MAQRNLNYYIILLPTGILISTSLTEPYTFEFSHIAEIVPDSAGDKINWIQKKAAEETSKFIILLREIIREILKGNVYKEFIDT